MSGGKKNEKSKSGAKPKKFQLNKETVKDLNVSDRNAKNVQGGKKAVIISLTCPDC